jgi:hypothetical protein
MFVNPSVDRRCYSPYKKSRLYSMAEFTNIPQVTSYVPDSDPTSVSQR